VPSLSFYDLSVPAIKDCQAIESIGHEPVRRFHNQIHNFIYAVPSPTPFGPQKVSTKFAYIGETIKFHCQKRDALGSSRMLFG